MELRGLEYNNVVVVLLALAVVVAVVKANQPSC